MRKRFTAIPIFAAVLLMAYMYSGKPYCVLFKNFWRTQVLFVGPLIPLFSTSGDVMQLYLFVFSQYQFTTHFSTYTLLIVSQFCSKSLIVRQSIGILRKYENTLQVTYIYPGFHSQGGFLVCVVPRLRATDCVFW